MVCTVCHWCVVLSNLLCVLLRSMLKVLMVWTVDGVYCWSECTLRVALLEVVMLDSLCVCDVAERVLMFLNSVHCFNGVSDCIVIKLFISVTED